MIYKLVFMIMMIIIIRNFPVKSEQEVDGLANQLIDNFLESMRNNTEMEVVRLHRNYSLEIYHDLGITDVDFCLSSCYIVINDGVLRGIRSIRRVSNGAITNEPITEDLLIYFIANLKNIQVENNLQFLFGDLDIINRNAVIYVDEIDIKLKIASRKKGRLELLSIRVRRIENVRIRFADDKHKFRYDNKTVTINGEERLIDTLTNLAIKFLDERIRRILSRALFIILYDEFKYIK